jgi:serine/threonine-protein kinase RsbW
MDTLRLPARMENIEAFRSFVAERMERFETNRERVLLIELGLEEFLTNVIKYAYPLDEGDVEVGFSLTENGMFRMSIRDWGIPFNPISYEDPDLSGDISERRVGGLGIYLVRRMFDEMNYEREDDANMTVLYCRR